MTEANTALSDGNLQFRRKIEHEMMENTIGVYTVDYVSSRKSKCTRAIVPFTIMKVKKHEGIHNKKAKKFKTVKQEH